MPYKSTQKVHFSDWETLEIDAIISDEDYAKIPLEYRDSWKPEVANPTHTILFEEGCVYKCVELSKLSSRQDDIKNWFAKKI